MPPTAAPQQQSVSLLLALPEPLLLAVLQCLSAASDHRSLFSAARAHSRLHQAAVAVLSSITVQGIRRQQVLDVVVSYLSKHGQHVSSVSLEGAAEPLLTLRQLPSTLQLHSLELHCLLVQLLPGAGWQGVLGPAAGLSALKQLRLASCTLLGDDEQLAAALALLPPGLEHLALDDVWIYGDDEDYTAAIPTNILQQGLRQLTHLQLGFVRLQNNDRARPVLQPLQALSRLADLRLAPFRGDGERVTLTASMLSGATGLTRLELEMLSFESGVLEGKTQLQHLHSYQCRVLGDAALTAQLLPLQQLTHLNLPYSLGRALQEVTAPPAAYSALTASSRLQHLGVNGSTLPAGAWQHVFPAGRRLPHLTCLEAADVKQRHTGGLVEVFEGGRLVDCCPGLRRLDARRRAYCAGALAALQVLTGLHTLLVGGPTGPSAVFEEVCQLTGLRDLDLTAPTRTSELLLLQTTQLTRLTRVTMRHIRDTRFVAEAPGDEPVWRQVLRHHLNHSDPAVAQQTAASLAVAE